MLTKADIMRQFEQFDKAKGKVVIVHTSLKAVGEIDGGGETLLSALIEYFTQDGGLLCVPTHTWDADVYDLRQAQSCIGVLPRLAAAHPKALRTLHPTHSMAIFGERERAEKFAKNEAVANTPASPDGCFGKLFEQDGYVFLIGVGHDKNTYLHCVEEMLDTPDRLTDYKVEKKIIHKDGTEEKRYLYWFDEDNFGDVSHYFPKFEAPFRYFGCITDGTLGNAPAQMCSARKMKKVVELIYKNNNMGELLDNHLPIDERLYIK